MSARFDFIKTPLSGLFVVRRKPILDNRGYFTRFFCAEEFKEVGFDQPVVQMNYTYTKQKGVVRGMHYQEHPSTEVKMVSCLNGEIYDVAVDLRRNSPTFLKWHAEILSAENQTCLYIPKGFAHGFQAIKENCAVFYMHSNEYNPGLAKGVNATDPALSIKWPEPISDRSYNDVSLDPIGASFEGLDIEL